LERAPWHASFANDNAMDALRGRGRALRAASRGA
jgi:hypothetical protein